MSLDFTLKSYASILTSLKQAGFTFITYEEYFQGNVERESNFVIMRHDVDRLPGRSLALAKLEHSHGVRSSYYFRTKPTSWDDAIMKSIAEMGHEIGYHYENLSDTNGDLNNGFKDFESNFLRFRSIYPVKSIAMHGRPFSKWDNRDLWDEFEYKNLGILGEVYLDTDWSNVDYFTDTGRAWDSSANLKDRPKDSSTPQEGERASVKVSKTPELIDYISKTDRDLIISTHPERWTSSISGWLQVLSQDSLTNILKYFFKLIFRK
jgi:hypothetical protein